MYRTLLIALGSLLLSNLVHAGGPPDAPPPRSIPGVTAPDTHPQACVSCHVDMPARGIDARLTTAMKRFEGGVEPKLMSRVEATIEGTRRLSGKHPSVADSLESIPETCISCHDSTESAPKFSRLMHAIHLTGGEENHFLTVFQGECTHCHKLADGTAKWTVPSGTEK